ncbi:hypothetical protein BGX38DRAFT_1169367 [Terfezia claveryi]|nr:hypothetical protein BGX38DRAFT_1169367 [Terfezia claveryi]
MPMPTTKRRYIEESGGMPIAIVAYHTRFNATPEGKTRISEIPMSTIDPVKAFSRLSTNDAGEDFLTVQLTQFLKFHRILTYYPHQQWCTLMDCMVSEETVSELIKRIVLGWMERGIMKLSDLQLGEDMRGIMKLSDLQLGEDTRGIMKLSDLQLGVDTTSPEVVAVVKEHVKDTLILMWQIKKP